MSTLIDLGGLPMKRMLMDELVRWKESPHRKPLILKGVRQCGKTYLLKTFAEQAYENAIYLNLERNPNYASLFDKDFDVDRIITEMGVLSKSRIEKGKTLVILDEVQACPKAVTALKYFCEEAPEYHIAAAGSLIGISLSKPGSYPVGKVDIKRLYPMSFVEYLLAAGEENLVKYVEESDSQQISQAIHHQLSQYYHYYLMTGGMPEVVDAWMNHRDIQQVDDILLNLLDLYQLDFAKHAPPKDFQKISQVWEAIPQQLAKENQRFMFGQVKEGSRAKDLEDALTWLVDAGMVCRVSKVEKPFVPLSAYAKQNLFKVYACDVGLLRRLARLDADLIISGNSQYTEFKGALAENFVLQQLLFMGLDLPYYWSSGNLAEVDFVVQLQGLPTPIEVKAGKTIRSKSLVSYVDKYKPATAYRLSSAPRRNKGVIVDLPLYLVWTMR